MARLGFYNIITIECLAREIYTRKHQYIPLTKASEAEAASKAEEEKKDVVGQQNIANYQAPEGSHNKIRNNRKMK